VRRGHAVRRTVGPRNLHASAYTQNRGSEPMLTWMPAGAHATTEPDTTQVTRAGAQTVPGIQTHPRRRDQTHSP
jgi:hypothetical protein